MILEHIRLEDTDNTFAVYVFRKKIKTENWILESSFDHVQVGERS